MRDFYYYTPNTLAEALDLLEERLAARQDVERARTCRGHAREAHGGEGRIRSAVGVSAITG